MFQSILSTLDRHCHISEDTEISMEGNPSSTTSVNVLQSLRDIGINRYSLGVQSFQERILRELGRDHTPSSALRSLLDARSVWPGRVSMDLIMGHAGQTLEDWEKELRFTMDVVDNHLSLYHLTVEPGTAQDILPYFTVVSLHKNVARGTVVLPDYDLTTDMYETMIKVTGEAGFEHYEVSNFARKQAYSKHNSGHWLGIDYLVINLDETMRELVVLGMRTKLGVELGRFRRLTGQELLEFLDRDATRSSIEAGLLTLTDTALSPTERADISLAAFGRKEIELAENEMPGLIALRQKYGPQQVLK
ncbi:radical S-adenosyl methionine domain-containing protein 1, partial [Dissophora globulifera]